MPRWWSSGSPANRKTSRITKTKAADLNAMRCRSECVLPAVMPRKIGTTPIGLTTGKSAPNDSPMALSIGRA